MDEAAPARPTEAPPAPLAAGRLDRIPGVLGRIARERAADYAGAPLGDGGAAPRAGRPALAWARPPAFAGALLRAKASAVEAGRAPLAVIAEIKRSSPSQGSIAPLDPVAAARQYAAGGAAALSVLTEPRHFGGDLAHLRAVAAAVPLPVLRKEFVVHPHQVWEAKEAGAGAVLLMVSVLGEATAAYLRYATSLGLEALVEVHDDGELETALSAGAALLGVNNRDLATLTIDLATAPRLIEAARAAGYEGVTVAESGYASPRDLTTVAGLADAVLVGTSLAGSGDLTGALLRLTATAE